MTNDWEELEGWEEVINSRMLFGEWERIIPIKYIEKLKEIKRNRKIAMEDFKNMRF